MQWVDKLRVYHGEWTPLESPMGKTRGAAGPKGFWRRDFLRDSIHHDTPKAFPHIFILLSSRTSKEGLLFPMVPLAQPSECRRQCTLNIVNAQTAAQQQSNGSYEARMSGKCGEWRD